MQTPDVIKLKKGLESCSSDECHVNHGGCPYITSALCLTDMAGDALDYINQLEQRLASVGKTCTEWINVHDMEPGDNTLAVVLARDFDNWDVSTFQITLMKDGEWDIESPWVVTHWMPLPEPPKEDD